MYVITVLSSASESTPLAYNFFTDISPGLYQRISLQCAAIHCAAALKHRRERELLRRRTHQNMCLRRRLSGGIQCRSTALCGNAARSSSVFLASRSLSYTHCHCLKARARAGKPASPSVSVKNSSHQHNSDWTVSEGEPVLQTTSISINPFARIAPPPKVEVPTGRIPGYSILKPKTWVSSWGTIVKPKYVGHHLTTIELDQLQLFREDVTCASGHEVIASYSHVGTTGTIPRKIFVPGKLDGV